MVRKIPLEIEQKILDQYYTATAKELGLKYRVNPNTVKGIWQRNGYTGKNNFTPNEKEFIELYKTKSNKELAEFYQKDRHTITNFAKKIGIYKPPEKILTSQQEQEIIEAYYFNTSIELAEKYKVSKGKICQVWKQANLKGKTNKTYHCDESYFEKIDTEEKAYWLGFIASDGCLCHPKDTRQDMLSITLKIQDEKHFRKI